MRRRVILLGDERKQGVREGADRARESLRPVADVVAVDLRGGFGVGAEQADVAVILGGDGSILAAAQRMGARPIPTLGVNFGRFGFLADITARDMERELPVVLSRDLLVESRFVLMAVVPAPEGAPEVLYALNEFYAGPQRVGRVMTIDVFLDGEYANTYRGDGLLVGTPTGSTGHSLSAGGPIVDPTLSAVLLTPVSPHSLTNRPIVLPPGVRVDLRPKRDHTQTHATFSADGQVERALPMGASAVVTAAPFRFPLVRSGLRPRYGILRTRLGWRGQPPEFPGGDQA